MSTDIWMDKHVVHTYNGILLSHKKEQNWVMCSDVDESRAYHTEWSKLEIEKQIQYINVYIWNLEKWYQWAYLHGRNRDPDVENGLVKQWRKERVGQIDAGALTYIHRHHVKQPASGELLRSTGAQPGALWWPRGVGEGDGMEAKGGGRYVYTWLIHAVVQQNPTQYCKAIILQ